AQFTFTPDLIESSADLQDPASNPGDVVAKAELTNNSNQTITYVWERIVNDLPASTSWQSAVCDLNSCYLPFISTKEFILEPGQTSNIDVHIYPGGTPGNLDNALPGEGEVQLRIWEKDNEASAQDGVFKFVVTDGVTSTEDLDLQELQVFPNPVNDYFQVTDHPFVKQIEVFNLVGSRMMHSPVNPSQQYDVSMLNKGIYLVQLKNKEGQTIKTVKLFKS
ncbi:MAG: T9SS type A sorting domain-containing protein, partial [Bacteroidota bacterium]